MSKTYEVEVKSLLGSPQAASALREKLLEEGYQKTGSGSQLNHYFIYTPDDADDLLSVTDKFLSFTAQVEFAETIKAAKEVSVRTREADGVVYFVAKLSLGDDSSANGVVRHEIQEEVQMSMKELDQALLDAGLEYQAKWSRAREEYKKNDCTVTIDKNAGYGYLAEFEIETNNQDALQEAQQKIVEIMSQFGVAELAQDRLGRMFDFYNENWRDYYGTDKIFTIE